MIILVLMFVYGFLKLEKLINRLSPTVLKNEEFNMLDDTHNVNLERSGLKFAF